MDDYQVPSFVNIDDVTNEVNGDGFDTVDGDQDEYGWLYDGDLAEESDE